ncbi:MAG: phosphoribosylamine--glycine ligase [Xanthomonadales bacterium]|nr:phosphoribosylamine--glycine ligase [Xanthomonadales bacterium]MBP7622958.1 phosphoribosylamine--glycine ligase [Xanthomonadales bacterium]
MKILVIGSGGREHALAWRLKQSIRVSEVIVAPGNAGTARDHGLRNADVRVDDIEGLLALAQREHIDLTVVGPEVPLVLGVVDRFRDAGLRIFGPRAAAAQLEGSKAYAKDFLARHRIPTAKYQVFTALEPALAYVRREGAPIVIKADGLAAGKGVVVALTLGDAEQALRDMLGGQRLGDAGARVVVEEFLEGEEASFIAMCDGEHALAMATSQDHKRAFDGDLGPNTGGMGAYSPAPVVTPEIHQRVMDTVILPTLAGMRQDGRPFIGFLYAGLMINARNEIKVLEFNVRFGDPETQPILLRLQSDLVDLLEAALDGRLHEVTATWDPRPAIGVVLAAHGYPATVRNGDVIRGLDATHAPDTKIFHAGTKLDGANVVTAGGRVLTVCALGSDIVDARAKAYAEIDQLRIDGAHWRRDIAHRAIGRS